MSLARGEVATFHGNLEVVEDGWIGLRFNAPICMKLTRSNGKQIGPLSYDLLSVGVPVHRRDQLALPSVGAPVTLMAEVDVLERELGGSPLILRMLNVVSHDSPYREETK